MIDTILYYNLFHFHTMLAVTQLFLIRRDSRALIIITRRTIRLIEMCAFANFQNNFSLYTVFKRCDSMHVHMYMYMHK